LRAIRYYDKRDIRVEEAAPPTGELAPNELLVAPRLCGICGTDLHEYVAGPIVTPVEPHPLTAATLPQTLGHEFSAEVVDVGSGVTNVRADDRVSLMPLIYCGRCYFCRRGLNHLCEVMGCLGLSSPWGGMADLAVVKDYQVSLLPDNVTYEQGALIEPTAVAAYGVECGGVRPGDAVLITGAGPIGALAVLAATAAGASRVFVSEPNKQRARLASELGAAEVFDPAAGDPAAQIVDLTDGLGVDVAIECVGNGDALDACVRATRRAGVVVQTGLHVGTATVNPMQWALKDLTIRGTWCYPVQSWPRITTQIAAGTLPVEKIVSACIRLPDAVERGFDQLVKRDNAQVKVLVDVAGSAIMSKDIQ